MLVRIATGCYVPAEKIKVIITLDSQVGRNIRIQSRKEGHYLDATRRKGAKTIVVLDDDTVIGSPRKIQDIIKSTMSGPADSE